MGSWRTRVKFSAIYSARYATIASPYSPTIGWQELNLRGTFAFIAFAPAQ